MAIVPLTLAKSHMYIEHQNDDDLISHYIEAAQEWIADFIGTPIPEPTPATIKQAILLLVAHWYENREASLIGISANNIPFGIIDLIRPHREWSF